MIGNALQCVGRTALAAALCAAVGCSSGPGRASSPASSPSSGSRERTAAEVERLRAGRDRAFDEMEGRSRPAGAGKTPAPAAAPAVAPVEASLDPVAPSGPVKSGPAPRWVTDLRTPEYPSDRFILGTGACTATHGQDEAAITLAERRARIAVAEQIRVHVKSEINTLTEDYTKTTSGKAPIQGSSTDINERITTAVDLRLDGLATVDRWYSPKERTYWALAALDRAVTGRAILDEVNRSLALVEQHYQMGAERLKQGSAFQAVNFMNQALRHAIPLINYRAQLRVVAPLIAQTGDLARSDALLKSLWRDVIVARDSLRFLVLSFNSIKLEGARQPVQVPAAHTESALMECLRGMGLNTSTFPATKLQDPSYQKLRDASAEALRGWLAESKANCLVLADVGAEWIGSEVLINLRVHFCESRAELVVLDLSDARVVASAGFALANSTRVSNKDPQRAAEASIVKATQILRDQLRKELPAELGLNGSSE